MVDDGDLGMVDHNHTDQEITCVNKNTDHNHTDGVQKPNVIPWWIADSHHIRRTCSSCMLFRIGINQSCGENPVRNGYLSQVEERG